MLLKNDLINNLCYFEPKISAMTQEGKGRQDHSLPFQYYDNNPWVASELAEPGLKRESLVLKLCFLIS